jgi:hypothetical protein
MGLHGHRGRMTCPAPGLPTGMSAWTETRARRGRDRLDLDELAGVPEDGDTKQRARRVMISERRPDDIPGGHQVAAIAGRDIDRRLQHVSQARARGRQRLGQIRDRLPGLKPDVTSADDHPVLIERARASSKDQATRRSDRSVSVGNTVKEPVSTNERNGHAGQDAGPACATSTEITAAAVSPASGAGLG